MGPEQFDVVVIGAGISGLSTAFWLQEGGADVKVLEKDPEVGGTMKTIREEGYLVETGPNSALETTPLFKELVDAVGLESVYAHPVGKNRYILRDGTLHALPLSPPAFLATRLFSTAAKFRLLKELFIGRALYEETLAEFVVRRLGQEFLDYAIDPFVAGVYAARPDQLSVRAAFPKLYALEERYGGLLKGMMWGARERRQRAETSKDRAETFSFLTGMQAFPDALRKKLGDRVTVGAMVMGLRDLSRKQPGGLDNPDGKAYSVDYVREGRETAIWADAVVLATPAYVASALVAPLSDDTSGILRSIRYSPVVSLFLGFRREDIRHPLDGFGFLVPTAEKRLILGCLWSSSLFPRRSPENHVACTVFIGGARQPELVALNDIEIVTLAVEELKRIMEIQGKPVYWRVTRWEKAIPQYEVGYLKKMDVLTHFEKDHPGIMFCSNYRGGISVGDCLKSAHATASGILHQLAGPPQ